VVAADVGSTLVVRVTASNGIGSGSASSTAGSVVLANTGPVMVTFSIAAGSDDGDVAMNNMGASTAYPPSGTPDPSSSNNTFGARRAGPIAGGYEVRAGLIRFDTSTIPVGATLTTASLRLFVTGATSTNGRNLVAEWYNGATWPVDGSDYAPAASNDASTGTAIGALGVNAFNTLPLQNLGSISRSGYTTIRLHVDGGQPSGENLVFFAAYEGGPSQAAQLVVTYTTGS